MAQLVLLSSEVQPYSLKDDGTFPNNEHLPVLYYEDCLQVPDNFAAGPGIEALFISNNWSGVWQNGIYDFPHYHSTSHEVMGIAAGHANVQLGGPHGVVLPLKKGDVVIVPAGVSHCSLDSSTDFLCVGAYPPGQEQYDIMKGLPGERPDADARIALLSMPSTDPVYGEDGPLFNYWMEWRKQSL